MAELKGEGAWVPESAFEERNSAWGTQQKSFGKTTQKSYQRKALNY